jgi:hypothetical protein
MGENLHKAYKFLNNNVDIVKNILGKMEQTDILDLCPVVKIPKGTLVFHSNQLSVDNLARRVDQRKRAVAEGQRFYPNGHCNSAQCRMAVPVPTEETGKKPRIYELAFNPTKSRRRQGSQICACEYNAMSRMYGNFNPVGNYTIALNSGRAMKGTQIYVVSTDMRMIDTSFLSAELGVILKRVSQVGVLKDLLDKINYQSGTTLQKYFSKNNIDGLIMLDSADKQSVKHDVAPGIKDSINFSCYKLLENDSTVCPEFLISHTLGEGGTLGTSKLKILGMVDLFDGGGTALSRDHVTRLFNVMFQKLAAGLSIAYGKPGVQLKVSYEIMSMFKSLRLAYNGQVIPGDKGFSYIDTLDSAFVGNGRVLWIKYNDTTLVSGDILGTDQVMVAKAKKAEDPVASFKGIQVTSAVNIRHAGLYPRLSQNYIFKDGQTIVTYASNLLMYNMLKIAFPHINSISQTDFALIMYPQSYDTIGNVFEEIRTHFTHALHARNANSYDANDFTPQLKELNIKIKHAVNMQLTTHILKLYGVMTTQIQERFIKDIPDAGGTVVKYISGKLHDSNMYKTDRELTIPLHIIKLIIIFELYSSDHNIKQSIDKLTNLATMISSQELEIVLWNAHSLSIVEKLKANTYMLIHRDIIAYMRDPTNSSTATNIRENFKLVIDWTVDQLIKYATINNQQTIGIADSHKHRMAETYENYYVKKIVDNGVKNLFSRISTLDHVKSFDVQSQNVVLRIIATLLTREDISNAILGTGGGSDENKVELFTIVARQIIPNYRGTMSVANVTQIIDTVKKGSQQGGFKNNIKERNYEDTESELDSLSEDIADKKYELLQNIMNN